MRCYIILLLAISVLCSCTNDKPVPETKQTTFDIVPMEVSSALSASQTVSGMKEVAEIRRHVIGKDVYVECIIPNFIFRNPGKGLNSPRGFIELYVDNLKIDEISTAAFIIKDLEPGEHTIRIEAKETKGGKSIVVEEFQINIQH